MLIFKWLTLAIIGALVAFAVYVRMAPVDAANWHVDPLSADLPGMSGWLVRPDGGDASWPVFDVDGKGLLTAFDQIAQADQQTQVVAGSVDEGRITYVTRSKLWGFPDYTTVAAVPVGDGMTLAVLGRARFGKSDLSVNRTRLEAWYSDLKEALKRGA